MKEPRNSYIASSSGATIYTRGYGRRDAVSKRPSMCKTTVMGWWRTGSWLGGLPITTPCVRIRQWGMPPPGRCIIRPSLIVPSRPPGGGRSERGAIPGVKLSDLPFRPYGAQGLTPGLKPKALRSGMVKPQCIVYKQAKTNPAGSGNLT